MSIINAILVAIIATISSWWFSHAITRTWLYPLWVGFLTGIAMGEPIAGMQAAAYINLAYLGWITAGGTMPGNLMVAGVFGTAMTLISGADPSLAVSFAVPFSLLGLVTWNGYMTINSLWVHKAEKYGKEGNLRGVRIMNYVPSGIVSLILNGIPAFILVYYGGEAATKLVQAIPQNIIDALSTVGALMPALGIAMLLNYMGKKKLLPFFFLGFFLTAYLGLDIMAITAFAAIIGFVVYFAQQRYDDYESGPEVEDLDRVEYKKKLTKKDLVKHWLLGYSSETAYNYERLQALGRASASTVLLNRLYDTKEEKAQAIQKYFVFFNTEPSYIGTVIHGIEASMEEQIANGYEISDDEVNAVRTGLMGPIAGIGDTVSQGIVYPILAGIACSLALDGNILGPIIFEVGYKVIMLTLGYNMYMLGYRKGKNSVFNLLQSGKLNRVTEIFSIVGLMVVGSMAFSRVTITSPFVFTSGQVEIVLQDVFDMLIPGLLPLFATLGTWKLIKKYKPLTVIILLFVIGIVLSLIGLLGVVA